MEGSAPSEPPRSSAPPRGSGLCESALGDRFELPVLVQNQTAEPLRVELGVRAQNAVLTEGAGRRVAVPAHQRVEVRFPATTERPGRARFEVTAAAGLLADAAEVALPVATPATAEAFATYGEIDSGAVAESVRRPAGSDPGYGGLEIATSSTAVASLADAVLYLVDYPSECSEQLASRLLAVAALQGVLSAFQAPGLPAKDELLAAVKRDIARLEGMQGRDGGFDFWGTGEASWPYLSIHVAHALTRAEATGFGVSERVLARLRSYLGRIGEHIPKSYSRESRRTLEAYALCVLRQMQTS